MCISAHIFVLLVVALVETNAKEGAVYVFRPLCTSNGDPIILVSEKLVVAASKALVFSHDKKRG